MNHVVPVRQPYLPALIAAAGDRASLRFLEFFAAAIRNQHTRRAYGCAVADFVAWCEQAGVPFPPGLHRIDSRRHSCIGAGP